jgi:hypothetical protein
MAKRLLFRKQKYTDSYERIFIRTETIAARSQIVFRHNLEEWLKQLSGNPLFLYGRRVARNAIRPWLISWRRSAHIHCGWALGDALMCTSTMRTLKQANPRCRIHFYTDYPDLVRGLWYLDEISPADKRLRRSMWRSMWMAYQDELPPLFFGPPGGGKSHLAAALGFALVENGWRVPFTRTSDLVPRLQIARRELAFEPAIASSPNKHVR